MSRARIVPVVVVVATVLLTVAQAGAQPNDRPPESRRDQTIRYWTPARVANAQAREIIVDPRPGTPVPRGPLLGSEGWGTVAYRRELRGELARLGGL